MIVAKDDIGRASVKKSGVRTPALHAVILAAGKGRRMGGKEPKCLRKICGLSIIDRLIKVVRALRPLKIHIIVGAEAQSIRAAARAPDVSFHVQKEALGTADAAQKALPGIPAGAVMLVLMADLPLLRTASLRKLVRSARNGEYSLLTMRPLSPYGYGRILRDEAGAVGAIVVEIDATAKQRKIQECDVGVIAMPVAFARKNLPKIGFGRGQKERLITDLAGLARLSGLVATAHEIPCSQGAGVNIPAQLAAAETILSARRVEELAAGGVVFADCGTVLVRGMLAASNGVFVDRNVIFEGSVRLGAGVRVGANCLLSDCRVGRFTVIEPFCHLSGSVLGAGVRVGPFARLREGTKVQAGARVGNFVELKKAVVGKGSKLGHFGYLGDISIGNAVNVGAGMVVCNYDGVTKHKSAVGNGAFVGSNSTLVSPVEVGENSYVAAGSVITADVPQDTLVFGRVKGQAQRPLGKRRGKR